MFTRRSQFAAIATAVAISGLVTLQNGGVSHMSLFWAQPTSSKSLSQLTTGALKWRRVTDFDISDHKLGTMLDCKLTPNLFMAPFSMHTTSSFCFKRPEFIKSLYEWVLIKDPNSVTEDIQSLNILARSSWIRLTNRAWAAMHALRYRRVTWVLLGKQNWSSKRQIVSHEPCLLILLRLWKLQLRILFTMQPWPACGFAQ